MGLAGAAWVAPAVAADQQDVLAGESSRRSATTVARASLSAPARTDFASLRPHVRNSLATPMAQRLQLAFPLALRRVSEKPSCRGLFEDLGTVGSEKLAATLYYGADNATSKQVCRMGARALTPPGTVITRLCPRFAKLSTEDAALTLIHEALHFAGLPERPLVPDAMSSSEINDLVKQRCFR